MRRVVVLGCAGSGKSTVARELGRRTGLPVVNLDELFWQPGWVQPAEASWRAVQRRLVAEATWVLDGNYASTYDERLPLADTVVVLDTARWRCLLRIVRRELRLRGQELAPGCPHRVDRSLLRYVWQFPTHHRPKLEAGLRTVPPDARVVRLRSTREVRAFLAAG